MELLPEASKINKFKNKAFIIIDCFQTWSFSHLEFDSRGRLIPFQTKPVIVMPDAGQKNLFSHLNRLLLLYFFKLVLSAREISRVPGGFSS